MAAGALIGALALSNPANAQDSVGDISERIESTFELVLGNTAELAIPLTRRALARRFAEDAEKPEVPPLAYSAAETGTESAVASSEPAAEQSALAPASDAIEEGSAEDAVEDSDIARLPRPRPGQDSDPGAEEAMGGPLDLVAGAADPVLEEQVAAAAPQPIVSPGEPAELTGAIGSSAPASAAASTTAEPMPELVASGACLSLADVTDKDDDFSRNAATLSESGFCIAEESFKERRRTWRIATVRTGRAGPLFAVMHDDEDMSFDTAVAALKTYGGTLVAVETGGKRNQDGIDPNRNFSADGVGCKKLGGDATPKYTKFFRGLFDPSQPIIALHNNTGKRIPTGGLGHVSMEDVPKDMERHESGEPDGPLAGGRALVLLTSAVPVSTTSTAEAVELSAKGINAVIESVREGKGDCSLSNYTLLTGYTDYLNVTVDAGERDKQQKIIDVIMAGRTETVATQ